MHVLCRPIQLWLHRRASGQLAGEAQPRDQSDSDWIGQQLCVGLSPGLAKTGRAGTASSAKLRLDDETFQTLTKLGKIIEQCDRCRGAIIFTSLGGGTGSGVGSTLVKRFSEHYSDIPILSVVSCCSIWSLFSSDPSVARECCLTAQAKQAHKPTTASCPWRPWPSTLTPVF